MFPCFIVSDANCDSITFNSNSLLIWPLPRCNEDPDCRNPRGFRIAHYNTTNYNTTGIGNITKQQKIWQENVTKWVVQLCHCLEHIYHRLQSHRKISQLNLWSIILFDFQDKWFGITHCIRWLAIEDAVSLVVIGCQSVMVICSLGCACQLCDLFQLCTSWNIVKPKFQTLGT